MIPKLVSELCDALLSVKGASLDENHKVLRILRTECSTSELLERIKELQAGLEKEKIGECLMSGDIVGDIDLKSCTLEELEGVKIQFVIRKNSDNGQYFFFTIAGLSKALTDDQFIPDAKTVWVAFEFQGFASWSTCYLPWEQTPDYEMNDWSGLHNPRKLVRDLSASQIAPKDVKPWLLQHQAAADSPVLNAWKVESAKRICWALPFEIENLSDRPTACVKGDRLKKCSGGLMGPDDWLLLWDPIQECTNWIYGVAPEAESKHGLFNHHLVAEWNENLQWPDDQLLRNALVHAKEAYRLHLNKSSKAALDSLSTLKRTLHDEVDRVIQNTRKIAGNLWRDMVIVISVIVLKFTVESHRLPTHAMTLIGSTVIIFIVVYFFATLISNWRFNQVADRSRESWRKRLYQFIDEQEYDRLALQPIQESQEFYRKMAWFIGVLYLAIIGVLIYLLYFKVQAPPELSAYTYLVLAP